MSRSHRQLPTLFVLSLATLAAGCSTDTGLNALENVLEASVDKGPMPHDSLFVLHPALAAEQGASLSLSADPGASFASSTAEILGTNLKLPDDGCLRLVNGEMPFSFTFYGVTYNRPYVCANGNVTFNTPNPDTKALIPNLTMAIAAPATADWVPDTKELNYENNVYWQVQGAAPHRRLIVTWHNLRLRRSSLSGPRSTFRLILHEGTNLLEFHYPSLIREVRIDAMKAAVSGGPSPGQYIIIASGQQLFPLSGTSVCFTPSGKTYTVDYNPCPRPVPPNSAPVADPLGPYAGAEGSPVHFNGLSSYDVDGDAFSFAWTFGDGGTASTGAPSHTYADEGDYPVMLTVTDPHGLSGEAGTVAKISNVAPAVPVPAIADITSGENAVLSATFSDPGVEDAPWKWSVDWGAAIGAVDEGSTDDQSAPISVSRRVVAAGTHVVTLVVEDEDEGRTTVFGTLTVHRLPMSIDVRPGSSDNNLNTRSNGKVWVAVLTTPTVDASTVLVESVRFGTASVVNRGRGVPATKLEDADGDGDLDLWLQFETQDIVRSGALTTSTTSLELRATLADGREASGTDAVTVVH